MTITSLVLPKIDHYDYGLHVTLTIGSEVIEPRGIQTLTFIASLPLTCMVYMLLDQMARSEAYRHHFLQYIIFTGHSVYYIYWAVLPEQG